MHTQQSKIVTGNRTAMKSFPPEELYYITVIDQLQSILERGILSHERIVPLEAQGVLEYTSIADTEVVNRRKAKLTPAGKSLWHYVNLYFQPRNPMMYRVVKTGGNHEIDVKDFVVIGVSNEVLREQGVFITDGNAATNSTQFYRLPEGMEILKEQWDIVLSEWWNDEDDSKRQIMAECLVPNQVKPKLFRSLYVADSAIEHHMKQTVSKRPISVVPKAYMFFN